MTDPTPAPDAAVQIVQAAMDARTYSAAPMATARDVVAALDEAGWLHAPVEAARVAEPAVAMTDELAAERARVAAVIALCDERDQLTYGDTPHPGYVDTDEIRAALDAVSAPVPHPDPIDHETGPTVIDNGGADQR